MTKMSEANEPIGERAEGVGGGEPIPNSVRNGKEGLAPPKPLTFDEYQKQAKTTAIYHPDELMDKTIWVLGITGEAGEVVEKWKKIVAYKEGKISDEDKTELAKELGDVVWYIAMMASALGVSFDEIMRTNLAKLKSRKARGVQKGAGDNR